MKHNEPDGRLRAAAPELLHACKTAEAELAVYLIMGGNRCPQPGTSLRESFEETIAELRAAIAKAIGGEE